MRFFVYEHFTGGGFLGLKVPAEIACEGYGMLKAFTLDLKAAGHTVTTLFDNRLKKFEEDLEADAYIVSETAERNGVFEEILKECDGAMIIAPETEGALWRKVKQVEDSGIVSLNCPSTTIARFSSKANLLKTLNLAGVRTPVTLRMPVDASLDAIQSSLSEQGYPLVFKPERGAGCSGISLVTNNNQVKGATENIRKNFSDKYFLIQKYVKGVSASVSLICSQFKVKPLTLNWQGVYLQSPPSSSIFLGGLVPYEHPLKNIALLESIRAAEALLPLRGYIGVDLVLTDKEVYVVEVNLRLTTSYVALSRISQDNLGALLIEAAVNGKLPEKFVTEGYCFYAKTEESNSSIHSKYSIVFTPRTDLNTLTLWSESNFQDAKRRIGNFEKELHVKELVH